jgi:dTDP-4-amino-4,6-dideoxygalactose transaminase
MLSDNDCLLDLPRLCGMPFNRRLLRYSMLVAAEKREEMMQRFQRAGLGVSRMYPAILPEIDGCQEMFAAADFPHAKSFASRILTLPTHAKVTDADIKKCRFYFLVVGRI